MYSLLSFVLGIKNDIVIYVDVVVYIWLVVYYFYIVVMCVYFFV